MRTIITVCIICLVGMVGCSKAKDKYAGEYAGGGDNLGEVALSVEKNASKPNEYKLTFEGARFGTADFFTQIKDDVAVLEIKDDSRKDCKANVKFFNGNVVITQDPCGGHLNIEGTYKPYVVEQQQKTESKTANPQPAPAAPAAQKIVFKVNNIEARAYTGTDRCQNACSALSDDVDSYLSQGWKVVSSNPRTQVANSDCKCDGIEYVISK